MTPDRSLLDRADHDLALAGEPDDVAGELRDHGRDQGGLGAVRSPARAATSRPFCRAATTSASRMHPDPHLALVAGGATVEQRRAQRRAESHSQQVAGAVQLPLAPALAAGQRDQHRPATVRGRRAGLRASAPPPAAWPGCGTAARRSRPGWSRGRRPASRCRCPRPRARPAGPAPARAAAAAPRRAATGAPRPAPRPPGSAYRHGRRAGAPCAGPGPAAPGGRR